MTVDKTLECFRLVAKVTIRRQHFLSFLPEKLNVTHVLINFPRSIAFRMYLDHFIFIFMADKNQMHSGLNKLCNNFDCCI